MDKDTIVEQLETINNNLYEFLESQDQEKWETGPEKKWTTGQHALHLLQSIKTLNNALSLPKFILQLKFGKANRPVRDFETVTNRYKERLIEANGITFGPSKNIKPPRLKEKNYLLDRIQTESKKLQYKTKKWKDNDLDTYILPHPLMGKIPVREIVMWTSYHVNHHLETLKEKY
ncbi:DinB family protein [Lacinutrix jangbogonensis]|uniref:DinB family protein n=1 Tax=Lacinutrix jangbogonensis TaxID=1469557 RepID=UPI00053E18BA|nr:DinB family protein [Lacinutrix jangbogonensis]